MPRRSDPGRKAATLLASGLVLLGGLISCAAISLSVSDNASRPLLVVGVLFALAALITLGLSERTDERKFDLAILFRARAPGAPVRYRVRRRKTSATAGDNQPPTADTIRTLSDGPNNWVPTGRPPQ